MSEKEKYTDCHSCKYKSKGCAWTCESMYFEAENFICPACKKKVKLGQEFLKVDYKEKQTLFHRKCYFLWDGNL